MQNLENKLKNLMKYGIGQELGKHLIEKGLSVTSLRTNSKKNLINNFQLNQTLVDEVKKLVQRKPIEVEVINKLIINNNFTCCACLGKKGQSFVIHHITEYEKTQDNSYENLAVLCPTCHDLAHRKGVLTLSISKEQLITAKTSWEEKCINQRFDLNIEPIFESWEADFYQAQDDISLEYIMELFFTEEDGVTKGSFYVTFLPRHNICLAGEFQHPTTDLDSDVEIFYWDVHWNMRVSKKKKETIILNYQFGDEIHWIAESEIAEIIPFRLIFRKVV